ncbi:PREDICTED: uncharacterized protein LOC106124398 [Papilio xuthus]|uniref:Uncharacterized protein LOC106124398 n=1 Tax=Papilio xuthus TaxID=66420 RepID=A0AAJ6ZP66_PAPXU|nr:PREDICTED: uncharacterized protein LOC106124398 [Papilio xuthus]
MWLDLAVKLKIIIGPNYSKMENIEPIPRSPLHLYIHFYCNKRHSLDKNVKKNHKLLKEATKSWLSLNDDEKQVFISKHNEVIADHKQKIAASLKKVKPYLRKKNQNHSRPENSNNSDILGQNRVEISFNESVRENIPQNTSTITNVDKDDNKMSDISFSLDQQVSSLINEKSNITQDQFFMQEKLPEPIPPRVMSGKELFLLLGPEAENGTNWESLPDYKKRHYQSAVLTIKRNYIRSYRTFLESLEPKELYKFYITNKEME